MSESEVSFGDRIAEAILAHFAAVNEPASMVTSLAVAAETASVDGSTATVLVTLEDQDWTKTLGLLAYHDEVTRMELRAHAARHMLAEDDE